MKIEINGRVVEVDDNFAQMSPDQQQEIVNNIASQLGREPGIAQKIAETLGTDAENPLFWSGVGAISGPIAGKVISGGYKAATSPPGGGGVSTTSAGPGAPGQKYSSKTGFGAGPGYTVREVSEEFKKQRAPIGSGKVSKDVTKDKPLTIQEYNELKARQAAEAERLRKLRPVTEKIAEKVPSSVKTAGRAIEGAASAIPPWLARGAAGASLGYQAADAYNRLMAGDIRGGIVGGLGAIGSGLAFIPHPLTRGVGTAMAVGAPMLNEMLDKPEDTTEGVNNPMAHGGLAHLAGGGVPKKMFQQFYRGFAGAPNQQQAFVSPQLRAAQYYADKRAAQTGMPPGIEAVQTDPFAGRAYGHMLPMDRLNREFVITRARELSPEDIMASQIRERKAGGLSGAY